MNKLTAIMTALLLIGMAFVAGSAMAQTATSAPGTATVYVIKPAVFGDPTGDPSPGVIALDFGKAKPGQTVNLATTAGATATGGFDATGSHNDGFTLGGEAGATINVSATVTTCDVGVGLTPALSAASGVVDDVVPVTIWVGGDMAVAAAAPTGVRYGCMFTVNGDYP